MGPSPLLIHREQLQRVAKRWLDWSLDLRSNGEAEKVIQGWVQARCSPASSAASTASAASTPPQTPPPRPLQEMWGYSIAAASLGIKHKLIRDFQVEPGALSGAEQLRDFSSRYYIFHYTYQFEYMMDGTPCQP